MGNAKAATDQQAFTVDPVGLAHDFGDTFGDPFGPLGCAAGVDQQGKFIAAQPGNLIAGFELAFEACHDLQDQTVTGLMPEGIVSVTKIVEVQVPEGNAAPVTFGQSHCQQGLEPLSVGDAG